jgi:aspartate-semialdehyde dehydrogenase
MIKEPKIAVAGASGAVGEVMLSILAERGYPANRVTALASERSAGDLVDYGNKQLAIAVLADFDFAEVDYALFSAGGSVSQEHAPRAAAAGAVVIDNTSAFRYDDDIPLVVPEVNAHVMQDITRGAIIANPNCSTIQMVVALAPIHRAVGITRINVATYQSVSGAGRRGLHELATQTAQRLNFQNIEVSKFAQPIAFNVLPQIDEMLDNGYSREEMKMLWETQKIFGDSEVLVNATAVRVPVFYGHAEAVQACRGRAPGNPRADRTGRGPQAFAGGARGRTGRRARYDPRDSGYPRGRQGSRVCKPPAQGPEPSQRH